MSDFMIKNGNTYVQPLQRYVADSEADKDNIGLLGVPVGSTCYVIGTKKNYMLDSTGEWTEVESTSGGGSNSSINADWNAQKNQPGYINNRPFYENNYLLSEDTVKEEDWSDQIVLTGQEAILDYLNDYYTTHGSLVGAVLTLTSSTESYLLPYNTAEGVFLYIDSSMAIGVFLSDNTALMRGESEDIGSFPTGDLALYSYEIKKIDEKFLPENNAPKILTLYAEGYHDTRTDLALYYDENRQNPITSDNCAYAASENWDIVKVTNTLPPVHGWESAINWLFDSHGNDYTYEVAVAKAAMTSNSKEIRLYLFSGSTEEIVS